MKKILLLLLVVSQMTLFGQYDVRNGNMSSWSGSGNSTRATYWNSTKNGATGLISGLASQVTYQSTDVPTGIGVTYSVRMQAKTTAGITQNGLMTTGAVNVASMTANTPNSNYNYTRRGSSYAEYNCPFTGMPDSIQFWAKCMNSSATEEARMNAVIHDDYDYHDPEGTGGSATHWFAKATHHFAKIGSGTWQQYSVPFVYGGPATTRNYILVTFTTNKTPGGGSNGDELYVTAVKMIYNVHLTDLMVGGVSIPGFNRDKLEYTYYLCPGADYPAISHPSMSSYSPRATVSMSQASIFDNEATVTITHSGWHTDSSRVYTVNFVHIAEPVVQPVAICGGGETTLSVTPVGPTARWYNAATDGTLLATGSSYTSTITESTTFYVSSYDAGLGCESERVPLAVTVHPMPGVPSVTPVVQCGGGEINLSATPGDNGNQCRWYANASSTEILASANTYSPSITESKSYFVSTYNTTTQCESERVELTVTINSIPASPIVEPQSFCQGNSAIFSPEANADGATYIWMQESVVLDTADTYTTPVLAETTTYTVKSFIETTGCQSEPISVTVTVFPVYDITLPEVVACEEYAWNGNTYTTSQKVSHTFQTAEGCDSIVGFNLIINYVSPVTEIKDTTCKGETYNKYGFNISTDDKEAYFVDSLELVNNAGCDSLVLLYLTINEPSPLTVYYDTICQGESYNKYGFILPEQTVVKTHLYTAPLKNVQNCDSIVNLYLTVLPVSLHEFSEVACISYTWNDFVYTKSGDYVKTFTAANGCDSIVTLHLTINQPSPIRDIYDNICQGVTYNKHGFNISTDDKEGNFNDNLKLTNSVGCDSLVRLHLTIIRISPLTVLHDTICQGETYVKHGFVLPEQNTTGNIEKELNLKNVTNCDSVVKLNLFVLPVSYTYLQDTILMGEGYQKNGFEIGNINNPNTYTYRNVIPAGNSYGCDSTVELSLRVLSIMASDTFATACESYTWFGNTYTESGEYKKAYTVNIENDSVVTLHLTINQPTASYIYDTICVGTAYQKNGFTTPVLTTAETYTDEKPSGSTNIFGCDSTIKLSLVVLPEVTHTFIETACISYKWNDSTYYTSGNYEQRFTASSGCDSIATLQLTINQPSPETPIADVVCYGASYVKHGFDLPLQTQVGTETHFKTWKNQFGCDSVVKLTLTVLPIITHSENKSACVSHKWNDSTYYASGSYQQKFTAANGCDSIVTLNLTINMPTASVIYDTICQGEIYAKYNFNMDTKDKSGMVIDSLKTKNSNDCDSIVTLYLTVNEPTTRTIYDAICQGETYTKYNFTINTQGKSGIIEDSLKTKNSNGCDSTVTLYLTINEPTTNYISDATCAGTTYQKNGFNLELDGTEETIVRTRLSATANVFGCDSTIHLTLTILPKVENTFSDVACVSYTWNDSTYNTSGSYKQVFVASNGCDSTVTLNLTINQPSQETVIYDTTCQGETYTGYGFDLPMQIQAGTRTHNLKLTNEQGCDSIVTLSLTVNRIYSSEITQTACDSYELAGETYTESGVYPLSYQTISGCDSTITLKLTINHSTPLAEYTADLCQGEEYSGYDFNLPVQTDTGTFVHYKNLKNSTDCDSIIRLTLTVHPVSIIQLRDTVQAEETYTANGFNVETTKTGAYRDTLYTTSSFGCDSTVILLLIAIPKSGVEQYVNNIMIELLPNPANDYVIIRAEEAIEKVEIINIDGKLLETQYLAGEQERRLNLSSYAKGFYFVKVTTNEGVATKKLIIQ